MRRFTAILGCAGVTCVLTAMSVYAGKPPKPSEETGPSYDVVMLDDEADGITYYSTKGFDINNSGVVVGVARLVNENGTTSYAACWTSDGQLKILKGTATLAYHLNDLNEVVGESGVDAVYWSSLDANPIVLPPLEDYQEHYARDISNSGIICGTALKMVGDTVVGTPIVWRITVQLNEEGDEIKVVQGPFALPVMDPADYSEALGINDASDEGVSMVVGSAWSSGLGDSAITWQVKFIEKPETGEPGIQATLTVLSRGGQSSAYAVNNFDEVVGRASDGAPMYWASDNDSRTLIGLSPENSWGYARDISNNGEICGDSYYYEYKGKQIARQGLMATAWSNPESDPILLLPIKTSWGNVGNEARAINDSGVIVVNGRYAFLAIPQ